MTSDIKYPRRATAASREHYPPRLLILKVLRVPRKGVSELLLSDYWIELATEENIVLALVPMSLIVPTTITRITASITAYSAISWPSSSRHNPTRMSFISTPRQKPPKTSLTASNATELAARLSSGRKSLYFKSITYGKGRFLLGEYPNNTRHKRNRATISCRSRPATTLFRHLDSRFDER
jgi:hypothetical protein